MPTFDNPLLSSIIPHISKEERYDLFTIVDKLLEGNYIEKAKALEVKQSAYYQFQEKFVFCWDDVPGKNSKTLKNFLINSFGVNWIKRAEIERVNNNNTIRLSTKRNLNYIALILNDKKTKVNLKTSGDKTNEFIVKKENGKLNVYRKNLEISDTKTLLLLQLLHDKDLKKFNEFLTPIVARVKKQVTTLNDCLNSGLLGLDFNLPGKLFDIYQRYETFRKDLEQKFIEFQKQQEKTLYEQYKVKDIEMYIDLYNELMDPKSIGEIFLDGDSKAWTIEYSFWKSVAKQVNFKDNFEVINDFKGRIEIKLTRAKRPPGEWFEGLFERLREFNFTECNSGNREIERAFELLKNGDPKLEYEQSERDFQEKLKEYRETLQEEFNKEGYNLNEEDFKSLLDSCASLFSTKIAVPQVRSNQVENQSVLSIINLLRPFMKTTNPESDNSKSSSLRDFIKLMET